MKFGQYELIELIAAGGMAEVFKGRAVAAEGFEKLVAIKRILPDLAEDERFVKMLLTEARIHSALSHRNIVQIHDLGISEDGQYFIVLEYVDGVDLRIVTQQLAAAGEILPEALSLHIASEVAQGLHFAHELRGPDGQPLGLIHRDVTPSNILVSLAGEVKLSDFGLAKRRHDRSVVGSLKGNLSYMSPEQARQAPLDRRTDVFSLGAVLFELLTGRRLREITDELAGWSQVASGVVPSVRTLRPDLPAAVGALLDRALAADPEARFADAGAFGTAIREVLSGLNVAVGASDLATLIQALDPPRRPRALMNERSKVIRLGPEERALREAIEAPATPAPVPIPERPRRTGPLPTLATAATAAAGQAVATPLPSTALPPPRPRGRTPQAPGPADPNRRSSPGLNTQASGPADPNRRSSPGFNMANGAPPQPAGRVPTGPVGARGPAPRQTPIAPRAALAGPRLSPARPFPAQPNPFPPFAPARQPRETARVQPLRARSRWRVTLFVVLLLLGGAAFGVDRYLIPLDVLITWRSPARLAISTDPAGAALRLDGRPVGAPSPVVVQVHRDLAEHVLEATQPGFKPARANVRYDKTVNLAARLVLEAEPPLPAPRPAAIAAPALPLPPTVAPARGRAKRH
ncbi:MAG: protein kinase [Pseudomonadota bacterium]